MKWAFGYPTTYTYGQPTIAGGRVFVTSGRGRIYSLDTRTGCSWWTHDVGSAVRTAISIGALPKGSAARWALYFGDEKANVYAVDAETGKPLWATRLAEHPFARITGAPILHANRLIVPVSSAEEVPGRDPNYECCKFRGSVAALDAYTGKLLWQSYTIPDPPRPWKKNSAGNQMWGPAGAAVWSAPTIDVKKNVVYAASGNSYTDVEKNRRRGVGVRSENREHAVVEPGDAERQFPGGMF